MGSEDKMRREIKRLRFENTILSMQLDDAVDAYEAGEWDEVRRMQQLHLPRGWYQDVLSAQGDEDE